MIVCSEGYRYAGLVVDVLLRMRWRVHNRGLAVSVCVGSVVGVFPSGVW